MLTAIHQPNFMPWLGYFHKILAADRLIFFDSVALSNGKTWTSRTKIKRDGQEQWLSMPVLKSGRHGQKIAEVEMADFCHHWSKLLKTIHLAYHKAPFYASVQPFLETFSHSSYRYLADFNIDFIVKTTQKLSPKTPIFERASHHAALMHDTALKTDYIIHTCQAFDVRDYLAGKGQSLNFLEIEKFEKAHIRLHFQDFNHPIYPQFQGFTSGLSILDALMHLGFEGTGEALKT